MADGNARFAVLNLLEKLDISSEIFLKNLDTYKDQYLTSLLEVYEKNAVWCGLFGKALLTNNRGSDLVIFVYNYTNRQREHNEVIEKVITRRGQEIIDMLKPYANLYVLGADSEKKKWSGIFQELEPLNRNAELDENRVIFGVGYEYNTPEGMDSTVKYLRNMDIFLRATQLRLSGMFFPALKDALFLCLDSSLYLYDPNHLAEEIQKYHNMDEEHDELNIYSNAVYNAWKKNNEQNNGLNLHYTFRAYPFQTLRINPA
jgi:hypothetical protein